ncbi:MAG: NAD(P)/FAD-dependent oxidoreductase [Myxococcales bacterium]|nr:NAD(P)/FAD-dependent oxidoreductase [Myxococcales bacterium]
MSGPDAVVIGSGPNGLAAAIRLAQAGLSVTVLEAKATAGGGMRTAELTLPGFHHDVCSSCHPMGALSPFLSTLPLAQHGLRWVSPAASVAHPLEHRPAAMLYRDLERTAEALGPDAGAYRRLVGPFLKRPEALFADALAPLRWPREPVRLARFGLRAALPAESLARLTFTEPAAQALLAGCAGHSVLPLDQVVSGALGLIFLVAGHAVDWPVVAGGSQALARALVAHLEALGGRVLTNHPVRSMSDLPDARVLMFDTSPQQLADIAAPALPQSFLHRLRRYRYGPGVFKVDWALDGPIPWADPRVLEASTVHVGGTLEEIAAAEAAVWRGEHPEAPYLICVQASAHDPSRAPEGKHTGYAYCHVPPGSERDLTDVVERQMERFAPGFRDLILARRTWNTRQFELHNANYVGGAVTGGVADWRQLFTRPVTQLDPYATPNPKIFLCSASTPPGGGVHGMCGYYAAESALRQLSRQRAPAPR